METKPTVVSLGLFDSVIGGEIVGSEVVGSEVVGVCEVVGRSGSMIVILICGVVRWLRL